MDMERLKRLTRTGTRMLGTFVLAGVLLAACGDDDDDDDVDISDELNGTQTVELTPPDDTGTAADTTPTEQAGGATMDTNATPTEDEDSATATDEEVDATGTEDDDGATSTEDDGVATGTEDDDGTTGTPTEDDGTSTAADDTGTATEDGDVTTPTEDDGTSTAADGTVTATEDDEASGTTTPADGGEGDVVEIGQLVQLGNLSITVEGAETFQGVPGVLEPDDDNRFIAVEVTVENGDSEPLSLIDMLSSMHIETGDGEEYDPDLLANAALILEDGGTLDERIAAGDSFTGRIGFEVPADADELIFVIETDDTGETVRVDISDELS